MEHRAQGLVIIAFSRLIIDRNMRKQHINNTTVWKQHTKELDFFFRSVDLSLTQMWPLSPAKRLLLVLGDEVTLFLLLFLETRGSCWEVGWNAQAQTAQHCQDWSHQVPTRKFLVRSQKYMGSWEALCKTWAWSRKKLVIDSSFGNSNWAANFGNTQISLPHQFVNALLLF